jgi:circadian clock protein KaiC
MLIDTNTELISTGVPGLDDILGGGLPPNRLYLIQGNPGVGKTTLALQFLLSGIEKGEKTLYITLSETREELEAVAKSHKWSLDGIELHELSSLEKYLAAESENSVFHPSEVELSETTQSLLDLIDRVRPTRAVFDSLSEMRLLARDPLKYRRQILSLKQFFAGRNCTVLLLDDRTSKPNDLQLESIAHGVIYLEQSVAVFGADRRRLRVQKLRGVKFKSGYHDVAMEQGGLHVFPRLVAAEHRHFTESGVVSSGIKTLDDLIGGGLDRGVSTLLLGPAGSGKSSIAAQFAAAAAQRGGRAAFYSFEESPRTLFKRCEALGIDLKRWVDADRVKIVYIDPAELSPGEFAMQVRRTVEEEEVSVVVIDSLNGYLNAMPEERFLLLQLHELLAFLGQCGVCTLLVVAQHGMLGANMGTPIDVSYLADTVLLFRLYELQGKLSQAISVVKRRGGAHDRSIRELRMGGKDGISIGEPLEGLRGVMTGVPVIETATYSVNDK